MIEVLLGEETSEQLEATTDDVNSTLAFEIDTVTDGQGNYVTLNSSGYLTIGSGADTSFYIDVSIIQLITEPVAPNNGFFQIKISDSEETVVEFLEVTIVTSQDDEPPEFSMDTYSFSLREDAEDGTEIGTVDATDDGQRWKFPRSLGNSVFHKRL